MTTRLSARPTTASCGIPELDAALGGLFWGDNVVWEFDEPAEQPPFWGALSDTAPAFDTVTAVTARRSPDELRVGAGGLTVLDAREGASLDDPDLLAEAIVGRSRTSRRDLFLIDAFEELIERWGAEGAWRFFSRTCPRLLGLGAIAHWSYVRTPGVADLRRRIAEVTQCVVTVGDGTVLVAKAVGRAPGTEGTVFRYRPVADRPDLEAAPAAGRLGSALRALRRERHLTQSELAELAGVSASAISQAERGKRGLSVDTLLDLSGRLGVSLDELLGGGGAPGHRLSRRDDPRASLMDKVAPLLDDPAALLRAYVVRLGPGGSAAPDFVHKGSELVVVAAGLVQVQLDGTSPVLRAGESLVAETTSVRGWRNMVEDEAVVYWVLRD